MARRESLAACAGYLRLLLQVTTIHDKHAHDPLEADAVGGSLGHWLPQATARASKTLCLLKQSIT
eukprot:1030406-Amphidinium_carterae.1